jgi:hypothetical protein
MVIPQFSVRWLFALTALCAGLSFVSRNVLRTASELMVTSAGNRPTAPAAAWEFGASAAISGVMLLVLLYVTAFLSAWLLSQLRLLIFGQPQGGQSPFAVKTLSDLQLDAPVAIAESARGESPPAISG